MAAFFKRIENHIPQTPRLYLLIGVISICIIALSEVIIMYIGINYISILTKHIEYFRNYNSIFILIATISLFLGFKQLEIKNNRIINKIASTTLGVYVAHDNCISRIFLWQYLFNGAKFQYSNFLVPHALISCLTILFIFVVIDLVRQNFIEKPIMTYLIPKIDKVSEKFNKSLDKLVAKLD